MLPQIGIPVDKIVVFCQRNQIRKMALFGSVLRDDFRPDSDVDVMVEFEPDAHVGWEFIDIQEELSKLLGREVDLHTQKSLSKAFGNKVIQTSQVIYERARPKTSVRYAERSPKSVQVSAG